MLVKNDVGSHAIKIIRANPQKDVFLWVIYSAESFLVKIIHSELKNDTKSCPKITYEKGGRVSMVCEFLFLMSDEIRRIIY